MKYIITSGTTARFYESSVKLEKDSFIVIDGLNWRVRGKAKKLKKKVTV